MICPKTMFIHYLPGGSLNLDHKKIMMTYKSIRTLRVFKCNSSALIEWIFPSCATLNWIIGNSRKKTPSISNLFALNHSFIRCWPKKKIIILQLFLVFMFFPFFLLLNSCECAFWDAITLISFRTFIVFCFIGYVHFKMGFFRFIFSLVLFSKNPRQ